MASDAPTDMADEQVAKFKASRDRPAVLKARLALVRSKLPKTLIFIFEGDNDKAIYAQWVRRVRADLIFEPFSCDGKSRLLSLRDALDRDRSGLQTGVYFFVDRDFDDLQGRSANSSTFVTDRYSVENYLVDPVVIDELLKNQFHCDGLPDVRDRIAELMEKCLDEFLKSTKELNLRVFLARKLGIGIVGGLPTKAKNIAIIALLGVSNAPVPADTIIVLVRNPTPEEIDVHKPDFEGLDARTRYRGKFSFLFFQKWLDLLAVDRGRDSPILFKGASKRKTVRTAEISASLLATLSPMPKGFKGFVEGVSVSSSSVAQGPAT